MDLTFADRAGQDRVGRSDARANDQAFEVGETGHEAPDKKTRDEPRAEHDRSKERHQAQPFPPQISFRKGNPSE